VSPSFGAKKGLRIQLSRYFIAEMPVIDCFLINPKIFDRK
jgi:hypothetical protein